MWWEPNFMHNIASWFEHMIGGCGHSFLQPNLNLHRFSCELMVSFKTQKEGSSQFQWFCVICVGLLSPSKRMATSHAVKCLLDGDFIEPQWLGSIEDAWIPRSEMKFGCLKGMKWMIMTTITSFWFNFSISKRNCATYYIASKKWKRVACPFTTNCFKFHKPSVKILNIPFTATKFFSIPASFRVTDWPEAQNLLQSALTYDPQSVDMWLDVFFSIGIN